MTRWSRSATPTAGRSRSNRGDGWGCRSTRGSCTAAGGATRRSRSRAAVKIDPDDGVLGAEEPHRGVVHPAAEPAHALVGVVVREDVRGALVPAPPRLDAHARVGLDVLDVGRVAAVLGDDPELPPAQAVANRRLARPAGLASGGLEQGGAA